ncbi:hypothetical protein A6R68_05648 [Neotoma lepida]|uniref:Uncharacterized protein n=1 Tax=Neotoma lepida TaxID=56216 RepID=A0A1A6GKF6_NEOLE|nr:hypothetical protein A6R68_05648 [Neotoma lepida]
MTYEIILNSMGKLK